MSAPPSWSPPDNSGLCTAWLTPPDRASLKGKRLRRAAAFHMPLLDTWPAAQRQLLTSWLKQKGERIRHDTLLKLAGPALVGLASSLLDQLLHTGAVELDEHFQGGGWPVVWVRFLEASALARGLGLPDPDAARSAWEKARGKSFAHADLRAAADALADLPPARATTRLALLSNLESWREDGRQGTWRDFSQFARGDTKAVTGAEKDWLTQTLDMESFGISGHEPLLFIAAPLRLEFDTGSLDLAAAGDFLGLSARTLSGLRTVTGQVNHWQLVENRTSFERVARRGDGGTLWLPGFPPGWWRRAVAKLLAHAPAPALIACDPDPAGLTICFQAGALWREAGLAWRPWHMAPSDLDVLPIRKPLTDRDQTLLETLLAASLPHPDLVALARHMLETGEKGEQEGFL